MRRHPLHQSQDHAPEKQSHSSDLRRTFLGSMHFELAPTIDYAVCFEHGIRDPFEAQGVPNVLLRPISVLRFLISEGFTQAES